MPMRGELVVPGRHSQASNGFSQDSVFPVLCFCSIGLFMTLYFAPSRLPFDELQLLVAQCNLFG